ncbi:G patch domain-containing protein [Quillaja saponaria]|uniref:G patch domain-containing protein n=1 Tax=Quillaja saponaria TaxID=32244 RepID=A0AAD7L128_QUISA|nr:G patch domain-containing protein [Quillaja saponaria]
MLLQWSGKEAFPCDLVTLCLRERYRGERKKNMKKIESYLERKNAAALADQDERKALKFGFSSKGSTSKCKW